MKILYAARVLKVSALLAFTVLALTSCSKGTTAAGAASTYPSANVQCGSQACVK